MKRGCIFTIFQLNRSIVNDIERFISEGINFMVYIYIYIYIYIYLYMYILSIIKVYGSYLTCREKKAYPEILF